MINVNELRTGNYIHSEYLNSIGSISEIRSDNATLTFLNKNIVSIAPYDELLGIPLTEEWLKKFGFKSSDYADLGISISLDLGDGLSLSFDEVIWIGEFKTNCKHVHQLQNLYFALTGEELIFTP